MSMSIAENVARVEEKIALAAQRVGISAETITLIAVSKQQSVAAIRAAYAAGMRHFGENRSAEFAQKATELADLTDIQWHFIGHLQSRQSANVAQFAHVFHAVDRVKIAQRLDRQVGEFGRKLPVFLEVNISGEATKGGVPLGNWENDGAQREALLQAATTIAALPRIEIRGLMTMARWGAPEAEIRTVFQRTRRLAEWLTANVPQANWSNLSMGMTDDFTIAIEEGATHIRVGRAIFGERQY